MQRESVRKAKENRKEFAKRTAKVKEKGQSHIVIINDMIIIEPIQGNKRNKTGIVFES